MPVDPAFAALREALDRRHRDASAAAFARSDDEVLRTGLPEFDRILGGGFPRGAIAALAGPPSSGRSALAARLLAVATARGLGALIGTELFLPALAAAGVRLERLMCVPVTDPVGVARAADIVLRSGAFGVVVIPALPSGRGTGSATWTRLASLTHRANAVLVAVGTDPSSELRYFASVHVETAFECVRWNGASGHCCELAGYDIRATVRKHKRSAPGASTIITCTPFEDRPTPVAVRERTLAALRTSGRDVAEVTA
jgi:hypothetical protein